ncbi:MAG: mismatch-specific DNA-glycosylase [Acidimicrobiales bacterium]
MEEHHDFTQVAATDLPIALADLHRTLPVDASLELRTQGDRARIADIVVGAGFAREADEPDLRVCRLRTLPDTVRAGMRLLVCGLNPSLRAADAGVGFVTPGNRFWPAVLAAGLVSRDRDTRHALLGHDIGMTDLVKRATPRADAITRAEYRDGLARLDRLCAWLQPGAVCMVGLAGWRAAADRRATAGWQPQRLGDRPVYVMPSTSGLNAATSLDTLAEHLRTASTLDRPVK